MSLRLQACSLLVAGLLLVQCSGAQSPVVRFDQAKGVFLLEGWSGLSQVKPAELADVLVVSVDAPDIPPLLGRHTVENGALVFTPQYKVQEGMRYKAVARIPGMDPISTIADLPKRVIEPSTVVAAVYPSTDVLPENQLKFYIHFSASMSQGDAFTHMTLMDDTGTPIKDQPFLARSGEL
jgi:hypothetical protein